MSKNKSGRHPFKWMVYDGRKVRIDREIAPLLANMWELGIKTTNSCQALCTPECPHKVKITTYKDGSSYYHSIKGKHCGDRIWLVFEKPQDLTLFLNWVAEYTPPRTPKNPVFTMYHHIEGHYREEQPHDYWAIETHLDNEGVEGSWKRVPAMMASGQKKGSTHTVWEEDHCTDNDFNLQPQLWFPRKHLPYVEERIRLALT